MFLKTASLTDTSSQPTHEFLERLAPEGRTHRSLWIARVTHGDYDHRLNGRRPHA